MWFDETSFTFFPSTGRMHVWRAATQICDSDCLLPFAKQGGGSDMICTTMLWFSVEPIVTQKVMITGEK
ncbi:hypothetical protein TNCV_3572111 [Trichonephila clavipes]|nr:hypothetical protein TNCV_3572111 [Trichonephila clavipes]